MENARGVVVEMGPMVTVVYIFMRGVPLIASVPTKPDKEKKSDEEATAREGKASIHHHQNVDPSNLHQIPSGQLPPENHQSSTTQRFQLRPDPHVSLLLPTNVPQLPPTMVKHHNLPYRPLISQSENNPQSLRYFDTTKPDQYKVHNADGTTAPGEKSLANSHSLAFHRGELIMSRVGYVALPIKEHYYMSTPTCNFLLNSFKHFDYDDGSDPK